MISTIGVLVALSISALTDSAVGTAVIPLTDLQAFEASAFCKQYGCQRDKTWALKTGGTNHSYNLKDDKDILVELATVGNDRVESYGLSFYSENDRLSDRELRVIDSLLSTIDAATATGAVRQFIRANVDRSVDQIRQAKSITFGRYRLWAGKVGNDQTVYIKPVG